MDAETPEDELEPALDGVLKGSLFFRQLQLYEEAFQKLLRRFVAARARRIWSQTQEPQRKGYHAAGIGLTAGQFLDANLTKLNSLLGQAEAAVTLNDAEAAATAVVEFAELVFQTAPFRAPRDLPAKWKDALLAWMRGRPSAEVISICEGTGVDLLQEALTYRLPWAMEAVRVHSSAVGHDNADNITGIAALAVEAGSSNRSVIVLVRNGLSSREAAFAAVAATGATFNDRTEMLVWLGSDEVKATTDEEDWPTEQSRHAWLQFYNDETKGDRRRWNRETQQVRVEWNDEAPEAGTHVVLEPDAGGDNGVVLSPSYVALGALKSTLRSPRQNIVAAQVGDRPGTVQVEYFGPPVTS